MKMKFHQIFLPLLMLIFSNNYVNCDTLKLYENLIECYRNDSSTESWIPNSLQILLELIRKIEDAHPTSLDIRYLSVNLIHQLRIDGIQKTTDAKETEFVIPYTPNGLQVSKFSLLLKLISDVPGTINFQEHLSKTELCTLHTLLSSTIDSHIRMDEQKTCKNIKIDENLWPADRIFVYSEKVKPYVVSQKVSKCPEEKGIIRTYNYGTFSPGIVIASIAAGLQPQNVQLREILPTLELEKTDRYAKLETMDKRDLDQKIYRLLRSYDSIDNTFASNLAGDLAEVCVYQAPYYRENVSIGVQGYWNDTDYPIKRYINEPNSLNWCMTDSEILAGIDGVHLSKFINHWVNRIHRMKLSQILEMFYSRRGILNLSIETANRRRKNDRKSTEDENSFRNDFQQNDDHAADQPGIYYDSLSDRYGDSACERKNILSRIPKEKLKDETFYLSQLLQYTTNTVTVDDDILKASCHAAVNKFFSYAEKLLENLPVCRKTHRPKIDLTLIIDGSRTRSENLKFISFIAEIIDVSTYASRLAVIHGGNGEYMVKPTHSIVNAFEQLKNFSGPFPNSLSLSKSFETIIQYLENDVENSDQISGLSRVILVVSQSQEIRNNDFDKAKRLIDGSFQYYRDLYFTFLTNNVQTFLDLTRDADKTPMTPNERFIIVKSINLSPKNLITDLLHAFRSIPQYLHVTTCKERRKSKPGEIEPYHEYGNSFETYVRRSHGNHYRINGHQLLGHTEVRVHFQGIGYGVFTVCKEIQQRPTECLSTQNLEDESLWFNITQQCDNDICPSIDFRLDLDNSNVKCTESTCRFPDDIRFYINIVNDQCDNGVSLMYQHNNIAILIVIFVMIMNIFNSWF